MTVGFLLCLLVLPVLSVVPMGHADAVPPELEIDHVVSITRGGVIIVNDTFRLHPTDGAPLSSLPVGFHQNFTKHLVSVAAVGAHGEALDVAVDGVDDATEIHWWTVNLPDVAASTETVTCSVVFVFSTPLNYTTSDPTIYTARFPMYPAVPMNAASCRVEIRLPTAATLNMSSWGNTTTALIQPLVGHANQTAVVAFTGTLQYLECTALQRAIVIEAWGATRAYDTYVLRNIGKSTLYSVECPLPDNASEVAAYDEFGPLKTSEKEVEGRRYGVVVTRYPLRGLENTRPIHDAYSFTLHYRLAPGEPTAEASSVTTYILDVEGFPCPDWTVADFHLQITFPEGATHTYAAPSPLEVTQTLYTQTIAYTATNMTCLQPYPLTVHYDYNPFWSAFRPTLWIGLVTMTVGGVAVLRKRKGAPPPTLPGADITEVQSYLEVCTERMGLWQELEDLENDLENRRIRRKGYNRRRRTLVHRFSILAKEAATYQQRVNRQGDEYAHLTQQLEDAEGEVRSTYAELDRLKTQRQRGRLAENEYRALREASEEKLRQARTTMEGAIQALRQLAE